jgi:hypothetical protein
MGSDKTHVLAWVKGINPPQEIIRGPRALCYWKRNKIKEEIQYQGGAFIVRISDFFGR